MTAYRRGRGCTVWFTGLSGAGKTTVATSLEQMLLETGLPVYVLDGDDLRHGLCADLGYSMEDRSENQRRIAHVAHLLADAGVVVVVPTISPLQVQRDVARRIHAEAAIDFFEVHLDTPLAECERRDSKGLYARARAGEIPLFTGIDSPYEPPVHPDLRLVPDRDADAQARQILDMMRGVIARRTTAE